MKTLIRCAAASLFLAVATARSQTGAAELLSPDGRVAFRLAIVAGKLSYSASFQGKPVLDPSALSLELEGQKPLGAAVRLVNTTRAQTDETYHLVTGKASRVRNHFNALSAELEETDGRKLVVEVRAYDDAVAFRYVVPAQAGLVEFRLAQEHTEFRLSKDATTYSLVLPHYRSMYESEFLKLPVTAFSNQGGVRSEVLIGLPMLLELPGVAWVAITEADLQDYSSMYLVNPSGNWGGHWFESRLAPQLRNTNLCVTGSLPHHSAWRVVQIGSEPGRLIESSVLTSLNPPSAIADTSWIHAGKAAWDWWSGSIGADGQSSYSTATMKRYVDFAAQAHLEYMLVDAGWAASGDITRMNGRVDIPEVVRYAAAKGVQVWIWLGYRETDRQMNEAFPLFEKWGVAGVKIDFIERDDQAGIGFYYRAAETAAQHRLMVDFHGCTKPTGLGRTWPNVLGYEAALGMEQSKGGARDNPDNHVMLPFTRMLAGPMDYTPGGFDNMTREAFQPRGTKPDVMGTRAHHLAMYVVYEAPFQMVSDHPDAYAGQRSFQFIQDVPATWDETRVLNGVPGEYVTLARRHGDEWFLGSMSNWAGRDLDIPLNFLGEGSYTAETYADAPDAGQQPKHVVIKKKSVTRTATLKAKLAPGGGLAVRFHRTQ